MFVVIAAVDGDDVGVGVVAVGTAVIAMYSIPKEIELGKVLVTR